MTDAVKRVADAIREHIRFDGTSLTPDVVGHFILGFEAAARAAISAMNEWRPIETAPKDTVILTDEGTATWTGYHGWCLCTGRGTVPSCGDWGREVSQISPSVWMPLPSPPEGE